MIASLGTLLERGASVLLVMLAGSLTILLIAAIAARLLHRASASVRHAVWTAAICSLLALPIAAIVAPSVPVRILPSEPSVAYSAPMQAHPSPVVVPAPLEVASDVPDDSRSSSLAEPGVAASRVSTVPLTQPSDVNWSARATMVAVWAGVALLLLAQVVRSRLRLSRLAASAWRVHDPAWWRAAERIGAALGLRRPVMLLATPRTSVPLTWGTRSPVVLLPADAHRWPAARREAVLVHELAHVARYDALGHDVARIVAAIYWANPLVWLALRAMRVERERACDDLVLATGTRASSYATDLLEIARGMSGSPQQAAAALAMARPSDLEGRLLSILDPRRRREPATRQARVAAVIAAVVLAVPLAALRPVQREQMKPSAASDSTMAVSPAAGTVTSAAGVDTILAGRSIASDGQASMPAAVREAPVPDVIVPEPPPLAFEIADDVPPAIAVAPRAVRELSRGQDRDLGTLIAVAAAAAGVTSSYEKAELLIEVLARGVRDDSLQRTVLRSAATIDGSYERHRVLLALLRNGVADGSNLAFLDAANGISSAHEREVVLTAFVRANGLPDAATRQAFLRVAARTSSDYGRAQLLRAVISQKAFDRNAALDVLPIVREVSSSHDRAEVLIAMARTGVISDAEVRDAFLGVVDSIGSEYDRDRVRRAAGLDARR